MHNLMRHCLIQIPKDTPSHYQNHSTFSKNLSFHYKHASNPRQRPRSSRAICTFSHPAYRTSFSLAATTTIKSQFPSPNPSLNPPQNVLPPLRPPSSHPHHLQTPVKFHHKHQTLLAPTSHPPNHTLYHRNFYPFRDWRETKTFASSPPTYPSAPS